MQVKLTELIAPSFYGVHQLIKQQKYDEFWLKGGRGSTKSTFPSVEIILGMMADPEASAVIFRKVKETLKDSVYEQLLWAIDKLQVSEYWECTVSPMKMVYRRPGAPQTQKILFRGLDKAEKTKSIKVRYGYFKYVWFEELNEFSGMDEVRKALQSVERGKGSPVIFYTYNPPQAANNWVNIEANEIVPFRYVHHSTYLTVPPEWLGEKFIRRAEHLRQTKPEKYRHEYLGEIVGTGGTVFRNLVIRPIPDEEVAGFDRIGCGIDWGYAADPFVWTKSHYDSTRLKLYIYDEIFKVGLSNRKASELIKAKDPAGTPITCDSAEPKSIAEMRLYGHRVRGSIKGPDSVEYGIKFLQDLEEIIIDPIRCPETAREFQSYELEPDKLGGFKDGYPDKDNHTIDATRYRMEEYALHRKGGVAIVT